MLVLSRHRGETIRVDDDMVITVVDIRGDKVRIGFDAPPSVVVHRNEVYEAIQKAKSEKGTHPNFELARKLREVADIIENFDFPLRVDVSGHKMTDEQIRQVKDAFAECYFAPGSAEGTEWESAYLIDHVARFACFKADSSKEAKS